MVTQRLDRSPQVGGADKVELIAIGFALALEELIKGRKIRRLEWEDKGIYLVLKDELLMIFQTKDKKLHPLTVSLGDIVGTDWVTVEEAQTIH